MPKAQPQLAKLTRPRLHKAIARERLFKLLDDGREHKSAICVVGPPGAGKTTLVASWLDVRNIKGIWYQVDPGDADLATFFYYLGEAANSYTRKRQRSLPRLTPEYLSDVEGFSRRFFRELFSRLPEGATLALDNYQEIPAENRFHGLVADAVQELSQQHSLVLVSRKDLPPIFSRYVANGSFSFLTWAQLRLDANETYAIATSKVDVDAETLQYLLESTSGWAAGVMLTLEQMKHIGSRPEVEEATQEAVFNYFATQIFNNVSDATRRFLMLTALLPQMTEDVCNELTGTTNSKETLDDLYRRHLFTDRRFGKKPNYTYHALFRTFLLDCAAKSFSQDELHRFQASAARLLEDIGDNESAFYLYADALRIDELERLLVKQAPQLLAKGRWQTFDDWISRLPESRSIASPWLVYWSGMARVAMEPALARERLEQAYTIFEQGDDRDGALLSASAVVQCLFLEAAEFKDLAKWLPVLERLIESTNQFSSPATELQAWTGMLVAIIFGFPGHKLTKTCANKIIALIGEPIDPNLRMTAAAALILHCVYVGDFRLGRQLETIVQPILDEPELTPLNAAFWYCYLGYLSVADHTFEHGHDVFSKAEEIGKREGFPYVLTSTYSGLAVFQRVGSEVDRLMKLSEPNMETTRPYDVAHFLGNSLYRAADRGDWESAVHLGEQTMAYLQNSGTMYQRLIWEVPYAWAWGQLGNFDEANRHLAIAETLLKKTGAHNYESLLTFAHANICRLQGDDQSYLAHLRKGFGDSARDPTKRGYAFWVPTAGAPRLCADALEHDIEPQFVREYIRDYPLSPPESAPEAWPWPIRIYTLGRFEIIRDDQPLTFSHKPPRRPLALVKALIALGAAEVPSQKLTDALWPDDEGDAALHALEVALVRLRKILGTPDAITVHDRALSLNRELVWTDVQALDSLTERLTSANDEAALPREAQRVFELYKGDFLSIETDAPWAVLRRERARARLVQVVSVMGGRLESSGNWDEALRWYQKGLDADDLAEAFYQGVMRCHLALDRPAEGLSTYRRMRQMLSVTLGAAPSPTSEAIYRDLQTR